MFKRVISTKDTSPKIAADTRNFIRKKRTAPKPEPKIDPKPKAKIPKIFFLGEKKIRDKETSFIEF